MKPGVVVVIVTYHSAGVIEGCLESLGDLPAVVVDNASSDGTADLAEARGVRVIRNANNRGFAAAVNQGVQATTESYVLLLNPDAALLNDISALLQAAQRSGLAAGRLVGPDGNSQTGFTIRRFPTASTLVLEVLGINRLWPSNPVNRRYRYLDRNLNAGGPVDQPAGAFLMFRRDVWETLGGFDESYFPIWFEDVDFARRAQVAGFAAEYIPAVVARHQGGHSLHAVKRGCRVLYWYGSLLRYAGKHCRDWPFRGVCLAVMLASVPRLVWELARSGSTSTVIAYSKVFYFAATCLVSPGRGRRSLLVRPSEAA